ncbi:MAG: hypothetical protein ACOC80_14715 [Petrotogales bacterium]
MRIETTTGKYGKDDKILLFTSTNQKNKPCTQEPITIFKIGLLLNQITINELQIKDGFKKILLQKGEKLFFEEAMKEAIQMAEKNINWAEPENWGFVKQWAKKWKIHIEDIEPELRRTFQTKLEEY